MSYNGAGGFSRETAIRRNMAKSVSDFLSVIDRLPEIHNRLSNLIVENKDALDIIDRYDDVDTLMYLDPPYVHSTRKSSTSYENEMDDSEHKALIQKVLNGKSKFIISGYNCSIYDDLNNSIKWTRIDLKSQSTSSDSIESLWINYKVERDSLEDLI